MGDARSTPVEELADLVAAYLDETKPSIKDQLEALLRWKVRAIRAIRAPRSEP